MSATDNWRLPRMEALCGLGYRLPLPRRVIHTSLSIWWLEIRRGHAAGVRPEKLPDRLRTPAGPNPCLPAPGSPRSGSRGLFIGSLRSPLPVRPLRGPAQRTALPGPQQTLVQVGAAGIPDCGTPDRFRSIASANPRPSRGGRGSAVIGRPAGSGDPTSRGGVDRLSPRSSNRQ